VTLFKEFILPRLVQWVIVIIVGVTLTFLIPRLSPVNPIDQAMGRLTAFQNLEPEATLALRASLEDLYGLKGTIFDQYFAFWRRVIQGDLGPSFGAFPMTVNQIISNAIWWTVGLLGTTAILAWIIGILLGSLSGYFPNRRWSQVMEMSLVVVYPVPYFIIAFILLMIFTYYIPYFPLIASVRGTPGLNWEFLTSALYNSFLPAISIMIGATAFRFIMSKALTKIELSSDYVQYAELAGLPDRKIMLSYVTRNTMLPQVTDLGLSLGAVFSGALITEVVFGYPGLGSVLVNAINAADYNVIMGVTLLSIVGIATASLLIDLSYPLLDPRIRYK
jgi:peptide/nickel transport system permease protein